MRPPIRLFIFIAAWWLVVVVSTTRAAETVSPDENKSSAEIAQLQKNAERLYFQFKPREAAAELQKILQGDTVHHDSLRIGV